MNNDNKNTPPKDDVVRDFSLTTFSLKNKTTIFFLTALLILFGIQTYVEMPKEAFPEVKLPTVYVGTVHPGNSPADMENLITRPIEKELNTIDGVDKITSNSVQDFSTIIVQFESDIVVEEALQDVKDAVDKAKSELPSDLDQDPNVAEIDMGSFPIMNINLSGDYSYRQLKVYAELLEDEIEKLSEINKVEIRGLPDEEVRISVDQHKMQALQISFGDIEQAISQENLTISGGNVLVDGYRRTVRVDGEFDDPKEMEDIIVKHERENIVYLRDIATVEFGFKERESYARMKGQPVVMLDVVKKSGENLLAASEKITQILEDAKENSLPEDLSVVVTLDQSSDTKSQVANLENSIISGTILVIVVLLFFLGTRNALFVGLAIPTSMLLSFIVLGVLGITINMMVLFGLIMALGMLVDNGIVVVENVYRLMDEGYSPFQAAKEGVGEVAWPIIASTATTLAAFLPLAIWPGIMGEFMKYLPITLIVVLGSSLFVALVINPVFTSVFMVVGDSNTNNKKLNITAGILTAIGAALLAGGATAFGNILVLAGILIVVNSYVLDPASRWFQNAFLPKLENIYESFLRFALGGWKAWGFLVGSFVLLVVSIGIFGANQPKVLFMPDNEPKYVNIFIEHPLGTDIEQTNEFNKKIEAKVMSILEQKDTVGEEGLTTGLPYMSVVKSIIAQVGQGTSDPGDPMATGNESTPHKGRITVEFIDFEDRADLSTSRVLNAVRTQIGKYPGVQITVGKDRNGPPVGKPINIELVGEDIDSLQKYSAQLVREIQASGIKGIEELKTDLETGKPEMLVHVDRDKARRYGISSGLVASELRTALFGKEVSKYKLGEDDYPIYLRLDDKYRYNPQSLMDQRVTFRDQSTGKIRQVPISAIAHKENSSAFGSIKRKDLDRVVNIYSDVLDGYNANEIVAQLKNHFEGTKLPSGYSFKFTGEQEQQEKEMNFMVNALMIAVFLILLIIVAQFNRLSSPVIILSSVILSTIGVFLGLVIFNMDFVVIMTMIGIISLAGIVVNNAIVLLDYTILLKDRRIAELGDEKDYTYSHLIEDVVQAGKTRLRPVLLTAITTVLGLLPLATGLNIDFYGLFQSYSPNIYFGGENVAFWGPMSWTIVFGLTFATFLTLVIVPVMFLLREGFKVSKDTKGNNGKPSLEKDTSDNNVEEVALMTES